MYDFVLYLIDIKLIQLSKLLIVLLFLYIDSSVIDFEGGGSHDEDDDDDDREDGAEAEKSRELITGGDRIEDTLSSTTNGKRKSPRLNSTSSTNGDDRDGEFEIVM